MRASLLPVRIARNFLLIACAVTAIGVRPALAQTPSTGVPVPAGSPLFAALSKLESLPAYRTTMTMVSNDPRVAQMNAMGMGFSPMEMIVKGGVHQVSMRMKMPAMDVRGQIDDWEIRGVVRNGKAARLITSPAVPRLMKYSEQMVAMQMEMMDRQAVSLIARAAAEGPIGAINAGLVAGMTAMANIEAPKMLKKEKEFFTWQCVPGMWGGQNSSKKPDQLTDLRVLGDQPVNGTPAAAYEFHVHSANGVEGPIRLFVAKDTGLPVRMEMTDPQGQGSMHMDYSFDNIGDIEIPACMADGQ